MSNVTAKITGSGPLTALFTLQDVNTGKKTKKANVQVATFKLVEDQKYVLAVDVVGPDGQKYTLNISGAKKATYAQTPQTLKNGKDLITARITG